MTQSSSRLRPNQLRRPAPTPTPDPNATGSTATAEPKERRDWLGTIIVPLVVGVIGAGLGSWVSIATNSDSIAAAREQAIEQFRRDERREQYATILQQATRLENAGGFSSSAFGTLGLAGSLPDAFSATDPSAPIEATTLPKIERQSEGAMLNARIGVAQSLLGSHSGGLEGIRDSWQDAYTGLDQAISNSEIASSRPAINLARALRDKYRNDYFESVLAKVDSIIASLPDPKPDRNAFAESLVGVPAETMPPSYDAALLQKSTGELTLMYVQAAKADLGLDDR